MTAARRHWNPAATALPPIVSTRGKDMPDRTSGNQGSSDWYRVEDVVVESRRLRVRVNGIERRVEPRVMRLLDYLAARPHQTVAIQELLENVWDNKDVYDNAITSSVSKLRHALGDSVPNSRFIEAESGKGYRLIAEVSGPGAPSPIPKARPGMWTSNPYVGLDAFDGTQADIFWGRHQTTSDLIAVLRRQLENGHRLVLVLGPSGSGKTSLLQAGVVPELRQNSAAGQPHAISVAHCDLSACRDGAAQACLAEALASWTLNGREVFGAEPPSVRAARLLAREETIAAAIGDAFKKHISRTLSELPLAHLLLVVDHAETLVASQAVTDDERSGFTQLLVRLCATPRVAVVMVVRSDDYAKLMAIPEISVLDGGDGSFYVGPPKPEDIADIIQEPARRAGVTFERDPRSGHTLDEVLRNATAGRPDALPLLQYTLEALYEKCVERDKIHAQAATEGRGESRDGSSEGGKRRELRFVDYRAMGELAGSIGMRAEQVYTSLPDEIRRHMDTVFAALIAFPVDGDVPFGRTPPHATLASPQARNLVHAFVNARLFVSRDRENDHVPVFALAHDAVLRNWKRAINWSVESKPLKQAGARLRVDAERWDKLGRRDDHLINPGEPLLAATAAARRFPDDVDAVQRDFLYASKRLAHRSRRLRQGAIVALNAFILVLALLVLYALDARDTADRERSKAQALTSYMLVEVAEELRPSGSIKLLDGISGEALKQLQKQTLADMDRDDLIAYAQALRIRGEIQMASNESAASGARFLLANDMAQRAYGLDPYSIEALAETGQTAYWLGYYFVSEKRYAETAHHWGRYLRISKRLQALQKNEPAWMMERGFALNNYGVLASRLDLPHESTELFQAASVWQAHAIAAAGAHAPDSWRYEAIVTRSWITRSKAAGGRLRATAQEYAAHTRALSELLEKHTKAFDWEHQQSGFLIMKAHLDLMLGCAEDAELSIDDAIDILMRLTRLEPDAATWRRDLAKASLEATDIAMSRGRTDVARLHIERAATAVSHFDNSINPDTVRLKSVIRLRRVQLGLAGPQEADRAILDLQGLAKARRSDANIATALAQALIWQGTRAESRGDNAAARANWLLADEALTPVLAISRDVNAVTARVQVKTLLRDESTIAADHAWLKQIGYNISKAGCENRSEPDDQHGNDRH